jgi:predicted Fe-S protein YdhL (DUF1289 family)
MDDDDDDGATRVAPSVCRGKRRQTDELAKWTGAFRVRGED